MSPTYSFFSRSLVIIAFCVAPQAIFVVIPRTCNGQTVKTSNTFVEADVQPGSGLLNIYGFDRYDGITKRITSQEHSYLTLAMNFGDGWRYFTNNAYVSDVPPDALLDNGVVTKVGDTIRTDWKINSVDIIQDVYPVSFDNSGQIVLKVTLKNNGSERVSSQAQYLLDMAVNSNDSAKILTRFGFESEWNAYPNPLHSVPPFYMAFESGPPPGGRQLSYFASLGYLENVVEGLKIPSSAIIGDWQIMAKYRWNIPANLIHGAYRDNGLLMRWDAVTTQAGELAELARTSYGNGEYELCIGDLMAIVLYPHRLVDNHKPHSYIGNPFTVEALLINTHSSETASHLTAKLTVGEALRIISPSPLSKDSSNQQHAPVPDSIGPLDVVDVNWKVFAPLVTNCHGDSTTYFELNVIATGNFYPPWPPGICEFPLALACSDESDDVLRTRSAGSRISSLYYIHDPVTKTSSIEFDLTSLSLVQFAVYDPIGRLVQGNSSEKLLNPGHHSFRIEARTLTHGMYFARVAVLNGQAKTITIRED